MSPDLRRISLIAASLGLILSLFFALRDDGNEQGALATTVATTTIVDEPPEIEEPPPTTTTAGVGRGVGREIRIDVVNGQPSSGIVRKAIDRGDSIEVVVRSDVADHIHVHGFDLTADVAPGRPARIAFEATIPGRFEVELEDRGVQIADLEVRP